MWRYTSNSASKWLVRGTSPKEVPISGPCSAKIENGSDKVSVTTGSTKSAFLPAHVPAETALGQADIPQIGFGPSPILLPFGSFGKVESSSLAKDGAVFICPAVPSLKNTDFPIIKTHLSLSFHSNA